MAFRSKLILSSKLMCQNRGSLFSCSRSFMVSCHQGAETGSGKDKDQLTHTGQAFDKDDYRMARFTDRKKEVNERFPIQLIQEAPPKSEDERVIWCDGGGGPTGHPRVYINLDPQGNHICGYCGLRFYKDDKHH